MTSTAATPRRAQGDRFAVVAAIAMLLVSWRLLEWAVAPRTAYLPDLEVPWWAMVVPLAVCDGIELRFRLGRTIRFATMVELPLTIGLFVVAGPGLLAATSVGAAVALTVLRYRPVMVLFNVAGSLLDVTLSLIVFHALIAPSEAARPTAWVAATVAVLVGATTFALRDMAMHAVRGGRFDADWLMSVVVVVTVAAVNATLSFLALRLAIADFRSVWMMGGMSVVLVVAYRNYLSLLNRHEGLDRLYETTRTLELVTAHEGSVHAVLDQALELVGGEEAELVSVIDGRPVRRFVASRHGVADERPIGDLSPEVLDAVGRLGADPGHRVDAVVDDGRTLVVQVDGSTGPMAVLRVSIDRGQRFAEGDRRLFEMFVNHAGVALQNSELVDRLRDEVGQREQEALHDALTSLPNRVLFDRHIRLALDDRRDDELIAVALLDLDRFKEVNDTLGHEQGDRLLGELARRLEAAGLERGHVVSRLGGDEFAVLMTGVGTVEEAQAAAARIKARIEEPAEIGGVRIDVTASVGVSVADDAAPSTDGSTLLRQADVAMYLAKRQHLGLVVYDQAVDPYSPERLSLAADLRLAVERGQIQAYFQPEVDLRTGEVVGVEALARWTHPRYGSVVPDQFIPIAEQTGLIRDLTYSMLDQSLRWVRHWHRQGHPITVAVNLSVRCLSDDDLVANVLSALRRAGVEPSVLTLEVTEGSIMSDPDRALEVLARLAAGGVRLSIDDFGMGYSSLAQLKRLPVAQLKVDRSFVTFVTEDPADRAIVESVTDLGHHLGLEVVAEGIEDRATMDALIALGCDTAQGYYLGRPMRGDQLLRWLQQRAAERADAAVRAAVVRPDAAGPDLQQRA